MILLGQDETVCKQYLTNNMCWHGKNGDFRLVPKDEGMGFMVSMVVSRDIGIGFQKFWNDALKQKVNKYRKNKTYLDKEAAIAAQRHINKMELKDDPFIKLSEYGHGATKEGYWTYDHMACQMEDCVDVLTLAFGGNSINVYSWIIPRAMIVRNLMV